MCGIAGVLWRRNGSSNIGSIVAMSERLSHRGPDGFGYLIVSRTEKVYHNRPPDLDVPNPVLAMAHRRLAIIDKSDAGLQPMQSADGKRFLVFNGEIYNYVELRDELARLGHRFATSTDSEVVLAAFAQWGVHCFARFNGMWAIAIYDTLSSTLTLSRDRLGVKPLFIRSDGDQLAFASEIKALAVLGTLTCNSVAMDRFLRLGVVGTSAETFFNGVSQFPPGAYAQVQSAEDMVRPQPFWTPTLSEPRERLDSGSLAEQLREIFVDSVRLRLRSDVPVGFCLSGGLDSSAIVGVAGALLGNGQISTFHARSEDLRFDESRWAEIVNSHVGAEAYFVTPSVSGVVDEIDKLLWYQDEPFPSMSIYAQWLLMKKARSEGIPVILDGQGSDELFAGYRKYLFIYLSSLVRRRELARFATTLGRLYFNGDRGLLNLVDGLKYMPALVRRSAVSLESFMRPSPQMIGGGFADTHIKVPSDVREMSVLDLTSTSLPSLLRYEDRNSMAWSIEAREPFLDFRLVDFALSLPDDAKIYDGRLKYVLREAMRPYLPEEILNRRDKVGFVTAEINWLDSPFISEICGSIAAENVRFSQWVDVDRLLNVLKRREKLSLPLKRGVLRLFIASRWSRLYGV
ncbi:MAG: asparagine synthase (glutamine-hydrolyzing) [Gammaproteobacteria bacterium]|nr:asparagine synthase (glutamine-hydrolyzing) [Gammaproteobacteria bacterium]